MCLLSPAGRTKTSVFPTEADACDIARDPPNLESAATDISLGSADEECSVYRSTLHPRRRRGCTAINFGANYSRLFAYTFGLDRLG